ncbi:PAS domain S-box-containing protein/diguanylate cyclase (GGDEF) domain-containing protein [Alteromonadaceae bacterium Bs31]|nr:PAS domain S-box-containing protein/diguanylate cyclase (GGDEF) domain-containing protein [Alteromonadaceae bacterium Bs31]
MPFKLDLKLLAYFAIITCGVMMCFIAFRYSFLVEQLPEGMHSSMYAALLLEVLQAFVLGSLVFGVLTLLIRESVMSPMRALQIARQTLDSIPDAVVMTDEDFRIVDVNSAFESLTDYRREDVLGNRPHIKLAEKEKGETVWKKLRENSQWSGEIVMRRRGKLSFSACLNFSEVWHGDKLAFHIGVISDITEKKQAEVKIQRMAHFDTLTALPNRSHFLNTLRHEINVAERRSRTLGLLFIDLDNFNWVNDRHGQEVGDRYLELTARKLEARARKTDFVFRIGGDEFAVLVTELDSEEALEVLAKALIAVVQEPVGFDGKRIRSGASIGIATYPRDAENAESFIIQADTAMHQAKELGSNSVVFFSSELEHKRKNAREVEEALRVAIRKNELALYFQPKIHYKTQLIEGSDSNVEIAASRVLGAEALLRWFRPGHDIMNPGSFIDIAEQSRLILDIGDWVLESACKQLQSWQNSSLGDLTLAVNLSPSHLNGADFVSSLAEKIRRYSVDPAKLELEITESAVIENIEHSVEILNQLKALGVSIAMDDFGTGFSSLSYLKQLPIDVIKIDRSFVNQLPNDEDDIVIVNAIFSISKAMNIEVVAEGIENHAQLQFLLNQGCEYSQGYYHSRPLPRADFEHWVSIYKLRIEKAMTALSPGQRQNKGASVATPGSP